MKLDIRLMLGWFLVVLASVVSASEFFDARPTYEITDTIVINLSSVVHEDIELSIIVGEEVYRYLGVPDTVVKFNPRSIGEYLLEISNLTTGNQIFSHSFNVVDSGYQAPEARIWIDKGHYFVDEEVLITIDSDAELDLYIFNEESTYRFLGAPDQTVHFSPQIPGDYSMELRDGEYLLDYANFSVSNPETGELIGQIYTIETGKLLYDFGEPVTIFSDANVIELRIDSLDAHFLLGDSFSGSTSFTPPKHGEYTVRAIAETVEGQQVLVTSFTVREDASTLPSTSLDFEVRGDNSIKSRINFYRDGQKVVELGKPTLSLSAPTVEEGIYTVEVVPEDNEVRKIVFDDLYVTEELDLGLADVAENSINVKKGSPVVNSFAIDPSSLNFTTATVTVEATGTELWKCALWNFTQQKCYGTWVKLMDLVPGQEYNFSLTPDDPGFAETGVATINTNKSIYVPNEAAGLIMVVLDTEGFLVPGASVYVNVTDPLSSLFEFYPSNITETSDGIYELDFNETGLEGNYTMDVVAYGTNVSNSMSSQFLVSSDYEFDIYRDSPAVIDPWETGLSSEIRIVSRYNVSSFNFTEVLPNNFTILENGSADIIFEQNGKIYLTWVDLPDNSTITYLVSVPQIAPELYTLGESYIDYGTRFTEARAWYMAVDPEIHPETDTDAIYVYRDGTIDTSIPQYSFYNGTDWDVVTGALPDVAELIRFIQVESSVTRNEFLTVVLDQGGDLVATLWNGSCWVADYDSACGSMTALGDVTGTWDLYKPFDLRYLGDDTAVVAYGDNDASLRIRRWNGSHWLAEESLDLLTGGTINYVEMDVKPGTNQFIVATRDNAADHHAVVYNGTNWIANQTLNDTGQAVEFQNMDVAWEATGDEAIVVYAVSTTAGQNNQPHYWLWDGTSWNGEFLANAVQTAGSRTQNWVRAEPDPNSDDIMVCTLDNQRDLNCQVWTGAAFSAVRELDPNLDVNNRRDFDIAWSTLSSVATVAYGERRNTDYITWQNWSSNTWAGPFTGPTTDTSTIRYITMDSDPNSDELMVGWYDDGQNGSVYTFTGNMDQFTQHSFLTGTDRQPVEVAYSLYIENPYRAPNVTLWLPADASTVDNKSVNFTFNVTASHQIHNCSLYTNSSGVWALNITNTSFITNGTSNNLNFTLPQDGDYVWNVECGIVQGNRNFSINNFTVTVDETPEITGAVTNNGPVLEGETITFTGACTNPGDLFRLIVCDEAASFCNASTSVSDIVCQGTNSDDTTPSCSLVTDSDDQGAHSSDTATCCDVNDNCWTPEASVNEWIVRSPPNITVNASDQGSSNFTPTTAENDVTFTITAEDPNNDGYYLVVCNNSAVAGGTCAFPGVAYCTSSDVASGLQASCSHDTSGEAGSYDWFAFACDNLTNPNDRLCDGPDNGTGFNGSPYHVNNAPGLYNVSSNVSYARLNDDILMFTLNASDLEGDELNLQCGNETGNYNLCTSGFGLGQRNCSFTSPWADNTVHTVYCVINDSFTITAENQTNITADNIIPLAFNIALNDSDSIVRADEALQFNISVSDANFVINVTAFNESEVQLTDIGGGIWQATTTVAGGLGCSATNGPCDVHFRVTDIAFNVNDTEFVTLTIDGLAPAVTNPITSDPDTFVRSTDSIEINVTATDAGGVSNVTVQNDSIVQMSDIGGNTWQATTTAGVGLGCTANNGPCILVFVATDSVGNVNDTETYTINVDDAAPLVTSPDTNDTDNVVLSTDVINITVTATDFANTSTVTVNGSSMTQSGTLWHLATTVSALGCLEGTCNLAFVATDVLGNVNNTEFFDIIVDDTRPTIELIWPLNFYNTSNHIINLNYTVTDNINTSLACNVSLDGIANNTVPIESLNGTFSNWTINGTNEGNHTWNVTCWDSIPNINYSETRQFTTDLNAPNISLSTPLNSTLETLSSTIVFEYYVDDFATAVQNCSLVVNGAIEGEADTEIEEGVVQNFTATLANGLYNWSVNCTDNVGRVGASLDFNLTIELAGDIEPPSVTLNDPVDGNTTTSGNVTFYYTPFDALSNVSNCTLVINDTANITNHTITEAIENNFTLLSLEEGDYSWDVNCTDDSFANNSGTSSNGPWTFYVRLPVPVVNLNGPPNATTYPNEQEVHFIYNISHVSSPLSSCDLIIEDVINQTNLSVSVGPQLNFTQFLGPGGYNWSVNCTDIVGRVGSSETWVVTITPPVYVRPIAPTYGTEIDRDQVNPEVDDNVSLVVELSDFATDGTVNFYANLTDPIIAGQTDILLGTYSSNDTGYVAFNFTGDDQGGSVMYAGNYTWWASSGLYISNGSSSFLLYGGLNVSFRFEEELPDPAYGGNQSANIQEFLKSLGPESDSEVNGTYLASVNATFVSPNGSNFTVALIDPEIWPELEVRTKTVTEILRSAGIQGEVELEYYQQKGIWQYLIELFKGLWDAIRSLFISDIEIVADEVGNTTDPDGTDPEPDLVEVIPAQEPSVKELRVDFEDIQTPIPDTVDETYEEEEVEEEKNESVTSNQAIITRRPVTPRNATKQIDDNVTFQLRYNDVKSRAFDVVIIDKKPAGGDSSVERAEVAVRLVDHDVKRIVFEGLSLNETIDVGIDDLEEDIVSVGVKETAKAFAIDPTNLDFENATVTVEATGDSLYKCKQWDFAAQTCNGWWEKIMDLVPGQEYEFALTPEDPGFVETIDELDKYVMGYETTYSTSVVGTIAVDIDTTDFVTDATYDQDPLFPSRLYFNETGLYKLSYACGFQNSASNGRNIAQAFLRTNGTDEVIPSRLSCYLKNPGGANDQDRCQVSGSVLIELGADSYVEMMATRLAGGGTIVTEEDCWVYAKKIKNPVVQVFEGQWGVDFQSTGVTVDMSNITFIDSNVFESRGTSVNVSQSGYYQLHWHSCSESLTAGDRWIPQTWIRLNGTDNISGTRGVSYIRQSSTADRGCETGSTLVNLTAGDFIELRHNALSFETAGTINTTESGTWLIMEQLQTEDVAVVFESGGGQSVGDASTGPVTFDGNRMLGESFSHTEGSSTFSVSKPGLYEISYGLAWADDGGGDRAIVCAEVRNNGATVTPSQQCDFSRGDPEALWNSNSGTIIANLTVGTIQLYMSPTGSGANVLAEGAWLSVVPLDTDLLPNVTSLNLPTDGSTLNNSHVNFTFVAVDYDSEIANCSVYINASGTFAENNTNYAIVNDTVENISINLTSDGDYFWNIQCVDSFGGSGFHEINYTFTVDEIPRTTSVVANNGSVLENGDIEFSVNCSNPGDSMRLMVCNATAGCSPTVDHNDVLCNGTFSEGDGQHVCVLTTNSSYAGTNTGYVGVCCDDSDQCDPNPITADDFEVEGAPYFAAGPSDEGSSYVTPTQAGDAVTFTARAVDPNADPVNFRVCNVSVADVSGCQGGTANQLATDSGSSGSDLSDTFTATSGLTGNYTWYAFTCKAVSPFVCSAPINGSGLNGTPFYVNTIPYMQNITASTYVLGFGQVVTITSVAANDTENDTLRLQCGNASGTYNLCAGSYGVGERTCQFNSPWPDDGLKSVFCVLNDSFSISELNQTSILSDNTLPVIVLNGPENDSSWTNGAREFNYTPTDDSLDSCQLYGDWGVGWGLKLTENNPNSGALNTFGPIALSDGAYRWNVLCTDDLGNSSFSPANYTFRIDTLPPIVELIEPPNHDKWDESQTVTFKYEVNDNGTDIAYCNLTINGEPNATDPTVVEGDPNEQIASYLLDGTYNWSINCTDNNGFVGESVTYNISVEVANVAPVVTLGLPETSEYLNSDTVFFEYGLVDDKGMFNCSLILDDVLNVTNTTPLVLVGNNNFTVSGLNQGEHNWTVYCLDNQEQSHQPTPQLFYVDLVPPNVTLVSPDNGSVFTTSDRVPFRYNVTDNLPATLANCSLYISGTVAEPLQETVIQNTTRTNQQTLNNQNLYWYVMCYDRAGWNHTSSVWNLTLNSSLKIWNGTLFTGGGKEEGYYRLDTYAIANWFYNTSLTYNRNMTLDLTPPNISLDLPADDFNTTNTTVTFFYNVSDTYTNVSSCSLVVNNETLATNVTIFELQQNFTYNFTYGTYYWSINCSDPVGNWVETEQRSLNLRFRDLNVSTFDITFSQIDPIEGEIVTVNVTVHNRGDQDIGELFYVNVTDGDPYGAHTVLVEELISGVDARSNVSFLVNWTASIGPHDIYAVVDVREGVDEAIEENNNASNNITVRSYHTYYGDTFTTRLLENQNAFTVLQWENNTNFTANMLVADSDSVISFASLLAIGRNTTGDIAFDDFADIDFAMNMQLHPDSVNRTWTRDGESLANRTYTLYSTSVEQVAYVNSTNNSNFVTGIMWDSSDANPGEYNGTQDLVFATETNSNTLGQYGTYDYELLVPALLREYVSPNTLNSITFYIEIT